VKKRFVLKIGFWIIAKDLEFFQNKLIHTMEGRFQYHLLFGIMQNT